MLLSFPTSQSMSMALRDWYANRELLLTGVTSDVGRALLEKILRSFPDVKVYVVLRSRHGFSKDDRIKNIFLSSRYEYLVFLSPLCRDEIVAFRGVTNGRVKGGSGALKVIRDRRDDIIIIIGNVLRS